jgi:apolipoprotein N-acyltransferase
MSRPASAPPRPRDRYSWLWLAIGAVLGCFVNFQTSMPVAVWLTSIFLLRFARTQRLWVSVPSLIVVNALAMAIGMRDGFFPWQLDVGYYGFLLGVGVAAAVPYVLDRLLVPRLGALAGTLVFPLAATMLDWVSMVTSELGTAGSSAYALSGDLPLLQIVAITGMWILIFLPSWLASVANLVWERGLRWQAIRTSVVSFVAVMLSVLLYGGIQLAFLRPDAVTVRVAALAPDRTLADGAKGHPQTGTTAERAAAKALKFDPLLDDLFDRSREAARAGAKIVTWAEAAGYVYAENLAETIERGRVLAEQEGIYLQLGIISILPTDRFPFNENRAILFTPTGSMAWNYAKSRPTPGDGNAPGPGIVPAVDTPYGRLATVICQDDQFPDLVAQAGREEVDILLLPSSDLQAIADWHSQVAPIRAVENGVTMVRAGRQGTSLALDHQGRLLGYKADYFTADEHTLITAVPVNGTTTLYPRIGDIFIYLGAAGLVILMALATYRKLRRPAATPEAGSTTGEAATPRTTPLRAG